MILTKLDNRKSGRLEFGEFLAAVFRDKVVFNERKITKMIQIFDTEKKGEINLDDLKHILLFNNFEDEVLTNAISDFGGKEDVIDLENLKKKMLAFI